MATIQKVKIAKSDLSKYTGRRGGGLSLGTEFRLQLENGNPELVEDSFTDSDGEPHTFPAVVALVTGREPRCVPLSQFASKNISGFAKADDDKTSEISVTGLCGEDETYEQIYEMLTQNSNAEFRVGGRPYYNLNGRYRCFAKAINKK